MKLISYVMGAILFCVLSSAAYGQSASSATLIKLPGPKYDGAVSIERALKERRSVRIYKDAPLSLSDVSQILWAAQGITEPSRGLRTAPSARAQYFLAIYLFAENVTGHAAQNVFLEGVSLGIGTVAMAGFDADAAGKAIGLPAGEKVLYIMPIGKK
ncbi:MAG: nitroreductase family protein [Syntrophorhabdaceae bacterium]|nr:nitroreductase family protein [Syntrophorhabdaceae bacterium]